jgi:cation diffusion facilitator CzcD-associated flavoprotein CzcO
MNVSAVSRSAPEFDAIVIGAGFAGLYALHKLRNEQGLKVQAFDKAGDVGGTWYWNRYPGALSDSETQVYCYSFDKDLLQEWDFDTSYVNQPKILSYLNHVTDRFDLRRSISFNTGIAGAHFDESRDLWVVRTDKGATHTARFLVTALGLLSVINYPNIPGRDSFKGELYHTGAFPQNLSFAGKRVGVIGTGSTGLQVNTALAPQVGHLTVFQRSPQYSVPVGNRPLSRERVAEIKQNYDSIWEHVFSSMTGFAFTESKIPTFSVTAEEREAIYERAWQQGGGFNYMFGTFNDIAVDAAANEAAASFIRRKIAQTVKDPETARKLTPTDLYARRPLCDSGYYEIFNRDNVALVDCKATPIEAIVPNGIRTADGVVHELDMIIFATGFDAVDGNYKVMDLRGRDGQTMAEHWQDGATGYMGTMTSGFPNMFMVLGPHGPFSNLPPAIEMQVEMIADLVAKATREDLASIEISNEAETAWVNHCDELAAGSLFSQVDSWIFGANIPGKKRTLVFYFGGVGQFRKEAADLIRKGYPGFLTKQLAGAT